MAAAPSPQDIGMATMKAAGQLMGPGGPFEVGPESINAVDYPLVFKKGPHSLPEWMTETFNKAGDQACIVFQQERLSYADVKKQYEALATALATKLSLRAGDRVGISMRNYPEWALVFLAGCHMGAIVVPVNSWWKEAEMKYGLKDSGTAVLFCDQERLALAGPSAKELGLHLVVTRCSAPLIQQAQAAASGLVHNYTEFLQSGMQQAPIAAAALKTDDDAVIMYTSGSTGNPKGVVLTQRGLTTQLRINTFAGRLQGLVAEALGAPPQKPADKPQGGIIAAVPLFHVTGLVHVFLTTLNARGKLCMMVKWDAGEALELIERERPTAWTGVPTMIQDMMEHPDFSKRDISSLETVGGGGAATPTAQVKKTAEKWKRAPMQGWGLTETSGGLAINRGDDYLRKPTSTGRPFPTVEMLVVDQETLEPKANGEQGELVCRSPMVMRGYWNNSSATATAIVSVPSRGPGWFRTGDRGMLDEEGFVYITGREKEIIIRGGENISCAEVENAFFQVGGNDVMEVCVFALPDERLGEVPGIALMVKPGAAVTAAGLLQEVRSRKLLADFKLPMAHHIFLQTEPLIKGATGKILRREIREQYLKRLQSKL
eukprot:TRINITY_DN111645_c0_g1_i1.p1 TRINITY_DN111645_c0_g1~~TRINITY_DN111645_c0_g1_i1.p1  ORF type:complete len:629 (-),score=139.46 TRINITY_DN111645_c0_g1_i1:150-1955(-)